jgi:hypothetical protein
VKGSEKFSPVNPIFNELFLVLKDKGTWKQEIYQRNEWDPDSSRTPLQFSD